MSNFNPVTTTVIADNKLKDNIKINWAKKVENNRQLIGSLISISVAIRPDIWYLVNYPEQFHENPRPVHLGAARRILRHLKGTENWTLNFKKTPKLQKIYRCWLGQLFNRQKTIYGICIPVQQWCSELAGTKIKDSFSVDSWGWIHKSHWGCQTSKAFRNVVNTTWVSTCQQHINILR